MVASVRWSRQLRLTPRRQRRPARLTIDPDRPKIARIYFQLDPPPLKCRASHHASRKTKTSSDHRRKPRRTRRTSVSPESASRAGGFQSPSLLHPTFSAAPRCSGRRRERAGPEGIVTRMAFCEALGWPAFAHAWVDPLDLAFRDLGLTGSYAIARAWAGRASSCRTWPGGGRWSRARICRTKR
jgi:hypothetical protein